MSDNQSNAVSFKLRFIFFYFIFLSVQFLYSSGSGNWFVNSYSAFIGEYHGYRQEKKTNYNEKFNFILGKEISLHSNINGYFEISTQEEFYKQKVYLERFEISYILERLTFKYYYGDIFIGNLASTYKFDVFDNYFYQPVLEKYGFHGLKTEFDYRNFNSELYIGGNNYNTSIIKAKFSRKMINSSSSLFYFYTGRNNNRNALSHSMGIENNFDFSRLNLYGIFRYELMPARIRHQKDYYYDFFIETDIILNNYLAFMYSIIYNNNSENFYEVIQKKNFKLDFDKWVFYPGIRIYKNNNFSFKDSHLICNYLINPNWFIGLKTGLNSPSVGKSYVYYGLQTHYRFNI